LELTLKRALGQRVRRNQCLAGSLHEGKGYSGGWVYGGLQGGSQVFGGGGQEDKTPFERKRAREKK